MPEPSRLMLLDQLQSTTPGTKVRFLGCVHAYDGKLARLTLRCSYPATSPDAPTATVNVKNVLESLDHELLETGAWLNIVGYVESVSNKLKSTEAEGSKTRAPTPITALMIWSAGAIKLDRYETAVLGYQKPLIPG